MSSAVVLFILGAEMCELKGLELNWTWFGKIMAVIC